MKLKRLSLMLISILLCVACISLCACDDDTSDTDNTPSALPSGAVEITKDNLEDWFDIHTDYEHAPDSYSMVTLKASFVPKYELYKSTVVVNYSHNAMWDTYNKFLVVPGAVTLTLKAGNVTAHTENGTYSGKEYNVKSGTNTITINSVEGYVIKSSTQTQKPIYSEENGDELKERLSAFQSAFDSADIVSLTSSSRESITNVFSEYSNNTSNVAISLKRSTSEINFLNTTNGFGYGYYLSNGTYRQEHYNTQSGVTISESSLAFAKQLVEEYDYNFTVYSSSDKLGMVTKQDGNSYLAKNSFDNIRFLSKGLGYIPKSYYGFDESNYDLFDVETGYVFDDEKHTLSILQTISLYKTYGTAWAYTITTKTVYSIEDTFLRLVDRYAIPAQADIQTVLDNCIPLEISDTSTVTIPLAQNGEHDLYFPAQFEKGMYLIEQNIRGASLLFYNTDGTRVQSINDYTMLDGMYLINIYIGGAYCVPQSVSVTFKRANIQSYPNYDSPIVIGADGKIAGNIECWGDEVVYTFNAEKSGLYKLVNQNTDLSISMSFIGKGNDEHGINPNQNEKLIRLEEGEYQIVIGTNLKTSDAFDFDLTLSYSDVQAKDYTLTAEDQTITIVYFQDMTGHDNDIHATLTIDEAGTYSIITTSPNPNVDFKGYVLVYDENGNWISSNYGTGYFNLTKGTYTVTYSSTPIWFEGYTTLDITSRCEKIS